MFASLPRWSVLGVSLVGAIEIMIEQTTNQRFKEIIQKVGDDVRKVSQLSAALAGFPDVFPILMVHMIEAGEIAAVCWRQYYIVWQSSTRRIIA